MKEIKAEPPSKPQKIGRHTYRVLTDEEARQKYGTSFFFVGGVQKPPTKRRKLPNQRKWEMKLAELFGEHGLNL